MKKVILFSFLGLLLLWVTGIVLENFFNVDLDKYFNRSSSATQAASTSTAPAADGQSSDWKTYQNGDFHFSVSSPYEWKEFQPSSSVTFKGVSVKSNSPDMKFFAQIHANLLPDPDVDLNKYMDLQIKMFELNDKLMKNFQMATSPVTVADTPGVLGQGSYQIEGKIDQEMKILQTKKGGVLLEVMCQYTPTDEHRAMADKLIHSLGFSN